MFSFLLYFWNWYGFLAWKLSQFWVGKILPDLKMFSTNLNFRQQKIFLTSGKDRYSRLPNKLSKYGALTRPFNLHLDFRKSMSWEIKVCFQPQKNFRSCKPGFFFLVYHLDFFHGYGINLAYFSRKKSRFAGTEVFLKF